MSEKNQLVSLGQNQSNPYDAKASEFPNPGGGKVGMAEGKNELVKQSYNQEGPRHAEDGGHLEPSVWGKGGKEFKVSRNSEGSTDVKHSNSVNLATGAHNC